MSETLPPAASAAGYGEAERQAAELAAVRRMLDASRDCFSLSVAVCNSPALRDYLIGQLREGCAGVRVVTVPSGTVDVFALAASGPPDPPPPALFLVNLEASLPSSQETQPTLQSLNASRELWPSKFPCPVVFWLPDYAAGLLSAHARDFWRYRSHSFEFVSEEANAVAGMADRFAGNLDAAANLSAEEKRFRIAELEQRIADAHNAPADTLAQHISTWLNELGFLHFSIGDMQKAEEMYGEALGIDKRLGRQEGMANHYGNLGLICRARGDLDRAEEMHRKSLEIEERLGRQEGMAITYGNLGLTYWARGDLDPAEEMFRKALDFAERLGLQEGMAAQYGNLGLIYRPRGDLDRAEEMYRKALDINERIGLQEGMAVDYGNLGGIMAQRGDVPGARECWTKALDLFRRMGVAHQVEQVQGWLDGLIEQG